jgi:hypothetical protein
VSVVVVVATALGCVALWLFVTWVLGTAALFVLTPLCLVPFQIFLRWKPLQMDEEFASSHPWRYHLATSLFRFGKVLIACGIILVACLLIYWLQSTQLPIYWPALYFVAFLASLQFFPTNRNSGTWFSSYSHRLKGGSSEFRSSYASRVTGMPPEDILGPIKVSRGSL